MVNNAMADQKFRSVPTIFSKGVEVTIGWAAAEASELVERCHARMVEQDNWDMIQCDV